MAERKTTGGTKEFSYNKEDLDRIRSTDTDSTKAFKEGYRKWQEQRAIEREEERVFQARRRNLMLLLIMLFVMLAALIFLKFRG